MEYLQSFSLRDFLIFSPDSYFKLFELSNKTLWPFHIPLGLLAVIATILLYKRHPLASTLIYFWLGLVWTFVGYWYFDMYYSQIITYANIISYAYWIEAGLLFLFALFPHHEVKVALNKWKSALGGGLVFYGFFIHPVVSLLIWNQPMIRSELFSITPDPTAIATIGFVLLLPVKRNLLLIIIPILWLILSFVTYQAF